MSSSEFTIGQTVKFKKQKCCGRTGWEWSKGRIRRVHNFEGQIFLSIFGYNRLVNASQVEK